MGLTGVLWRSTHPGPTLVVTTLALALSVAADIGVSRLICVVASVFLGQVSIGLSNDLIDRERDLISGRQDKPLAHQNAPARAAWVIAWTSAALAIALSAVLSWPCALAHAVFLACGWLYNAGLKSTVLSAACFFVGFGIFPSLAPLAAAEPTVAPIWVWIAGGVLGIAVHFSNVLPDLDDDARTGVRGLPHRVGARGSAVIAFSALALGALAVAIPLARTGDAAIIGWVGFTLVAGICLWGVTKALISAPGRGSFRLVMLGALLLAGLLVVSGAVSD